MRVRNRGFTLVELLIVVAIIGIISAIAIPNLLVAIQRAKQKRTMTNIRNIATAWEARASDLSMYNAAGIAGADVSVPVADVALLLSPTYIRATPQTDGWDRTLWTFMDRPPGQGIASRYAIWSYGSDGIPNATQPDGPFTDFDCDILYANGAFLRYPSNP